MKLITLLTATLFLAAAPAQGGKLKDKLKEKVADLKEKVQKVGEKVKAGIKKAGQKVRAKLSKRGVLCAAKSAGKFTKVVETTKVPGKNGLVINTYDKFKHCAVSCLLNLECGKFGAWAAGVGKEVLDLDVVEKLRGKPVKKDNSFGSGDYKANMVGIRIGAKNDNECLSLCNAKFPKQ